MKVALVHDYLKEYGGAERVLEALHEIWPEAPVYTLVCLPEYLGPHRKRLEGWDVRPFISRRVPFTAKLISPLRLLAPILFSRLDLTSYDVVIVSATGGYNPNLVKTKSPKKSALQICYCHTPPRYLYGYPTARDWQKYWWGRVFGNLANFFLRQVDFASAQKVDFFIANSKNTAARIKKFYRKKATVIYPPVEVSGSASQRASQAVKKKKEDQAVKLSGCQADYFLAGGRLARPKRVDLAIKACSKLGLPLKVFGQMFAGYGDELKKIAGETVEFLGEVTDKEKEDLMRGCQAFIFPAEEEDFGIIPVEVQACGRPVIAYRSGGVKESIIEGKTGEFFEKPTVESLTTVLKNFKPERYKSKDCLVQAKKFSKERFKTKIKALVREKHD